MKVLKVIKTKEQYKAYSLRLKELWKNPTDVNEDERELIEVLIDVWERENAKTEERDPVQLIKFLMENHQLSRSDMLKILDVNKSTISKILGYKKGLSKNVIRKLADHFKISQEAFNKPYVIKSDANKGHRDEKMMNTHKELEIA
jgi:HTH-type transcriptional regulator / antitoxin HigA